MELGRLLLWFELRAETRQHMAQLDRLILFVAVVMLVLIAVSRYERFRDAIVLAALFGAFAPFVIARQDLLIHRPAPAIAAIERSIEGFGGWENNYKPQLKPLTNLLSPLDVLMAAPIIFLFWYSSRHAAIYLNSNPFWWGCWLAFFLGCGAILLVLHRANQLMNAIK